MASYSGRVSKRNKSHLERIQDNIRSAYIDFEPNCKRFNEFRRFVFDTSITSNQAIALDEIDKPKLEFNILEAYVSRLRGEFSKQEPSITVSMADGVEDVDMNMINLLEWHLRALFGPSVNDNLAYKVYTDLLSGGFSVIKVYTEYASRMSNAQNIKIDRVFDPTMCGFDPLAKKTTHKGDGEFCFEIYPMRKDEVENTYGKEVAEKISYCRGQNGFDWSYQSENGEKIALIVDYYEKKHKYVKIVDVVNNGTMTLDKYKEFKEKWEANPINIEQVPAIIGKPRTTDFVTICRYQVIENDIVGYEETAFEDLPLIFIDGNSIDIRKEDAGGSRQMTRPYVYHAKGIQQLKNFAGQTLAAWMENMVMHRWIAAVESIPPQYKDAYINPQKPSTLLYNATIRDKPDVVLPPPREVSAVPIPPEVTGTFDVTDKMTQVILGSYDASLGINDNQLSGIAIQEGATQSNSTAMPYVVGYLNGLNQAAKIYLHLFPKYYVTSRTIPIIKPDGERAYIRINGKGDLKMEYDPNALQVKVEAGPSFAIQKNKAIQQLVALSKAFPGFAEFINRKGIPMILKNIEIYGSDQLNAYYKEYDQEQKQMMQMQQQMSMQNSPAAIKSMELQQKMQSDQVKAQLDSSKIAVSKQEADTNLIATLAEIGQSADENLIKQSKAEAEEYRASVDLAIAASQHKHDKAMDILNHHQTNEMAKMSQNKESQ